MNVKLIHGYSIIVAYLCGKTYNRCGRSISKCAVMKVVEMDLLRDIADLECSREYG